MASKLPEGNNLVYVDTLFVRLESINVHCFAHPVQTKFEECIPVFAVGICARRAQQSRVRCGRKNFTNDQTNLTQLTCFPTQAKNDQK